MRAFFIGVRRKRAESAKNTLSISLSLSGALIPNSSKTLFLFLFLFLLLLLTLPVFFSLRHFLWAEGDSMC